MHTAIHFLISTIMITANKLDTMHERTSVHTLQLHTWFSNLKLLILDLKHPDFERTKFAVWINIF